MVGLVQDLAIKQKLCLNPFLRINKKPFLSYVIKDLQRYGVTEVILLTWYKHEKIINFIKKSKFNNIKIKAIRERKS